MDSKRAPEPEPGPGKTQYVWWRDARFLMLVPGLVWAGNAIVARAVVSSVPPIGLAFWRWALAALVVAPFAMPHVRQDMRTMLRHWPMMVLLAALGISFFNSALYVAAHTTTALNIVMLQVSAPVLVVLASYLVFRDTITGAQALGIVLSLIGALTLITHGDWHVLSEFQFNAGDVWMLTACAVYALYTALLRLRPSVHPLSFLFASFVVGAGLLLPFYAAETWHGQAMPLSMQSVLAILYVGVFASAIGYFAFNRCVELLGANTAGLSIYLTPVFGTVLAILLLGEQPQAYHAVGIVLIGAGIVLAARRRG
ncbi:DMT family transporter [Hyphomicrobium sp. NDB2Meth4]|uniref:DMT family transporter n=1 Tax=Hyphomicrobium sp. NDB2Meth4 TaxID=1892846 RepID=UPI0009FA0CA5|nr:DMT family transporter [Hyphomicrobium sp. NDB2Meth4]